MILVAVLCLAWLALSLLTAWILRFVADMNRVAQFVLNMSQNFRARLANPRGLSRDSNSLFVEPFNSKEE